MYTLNLSNGCVTRDSDGAQVAPAQSVDDPAYVEYVTWVGAGNQPNQVQVQMASSRKITKLAFRNRFTTSEKVALEMASLDNPAGTMQQRQMQAALRVYLKDLDNATFVDLERADTVAGVNQLVAVGIISSERATKILTDPINPSEMPSG